MQTQTESQNKSKTDLTDKLWLKIQSLPYKFPVENQTNMFLNLQENSLNSYIEFTWPVLPSRVDILIKNFLEYKKVYGSHIEKTFYQNYTSEKMVTRLLKKRPLVFMGRDDYWHLRTGERGTGNWHLVGTDYEQEPCTMKKYITYEEMELSTFISLSIYTPFINRGSRTNAAIPDNDHEPEGFYIGQVGCRFEEAERMEWRYIIIDERQNTHEMGYGANNKTPRGIYMNMWASFYGIPYFPTYDEVQIDQTGRYHPLESYRGVYLDTFIYKKRLRMNAEVFLRESNTRAQVSGKKAFCRLVGLGLGVWAIDVQKQTILTLEMYTELLREEIFEHISDIYFGYFSFDPSQFQLPSSINGIRLHHGMEDPFTPLNDRGKIVVANWSWDSGSYVGNEYWEGSLSASGDPSSSCCSFTSYIGNPDLNKFKKVYYY